MELTSKVHFESLANQVVPFLPQCMHLHNVARLLAAGRLPNKGETRVFVDSWPKVDIAAIWVAEPLVGPKIANGRALFFARHANSATTNQKSEKFLEKVFKLCPELLLNKYSYFCHNSLGITDTVMDFLKRLAGVKCITETRFGISQLFYFPEVKEDFAQLPERLEYSELQDNEVGFVDRMWSARYPGSEETWRWRMRFLPNVAMREKIGGRLVGFGFTHPGGYGAHAYVVDNWRGRKLNHRMALKLNQEWKRLGMLCGGHVFKGNTAQESSISKLATGAGFIDAFDYCPVNSRL